MALTTRQKFSLTFSIYVSTFIAIVGAILFLVIHSLLIYQVQKDTRTEAASALKTHIAIEKDSIVVIKDKTGDSLSDEAVESNTSILLLDNNLNVVKGFGLLELYNQGDAESVKIIAKMAQDAKNTNKAYTKMISWRGQNLSVYVAPIKNNGKIYGTIVTAKTLTEGESLERMILFTLLGLTAGSVLVSLVLSRLLVNRVFKPIRDLTDIISATNLDKLDKTYFSTGNKSDELIILGDKFNEMIVRLKSMSEQQKEFIANASHELKTPLSRAISSFDLAVSLKQADHQALGEIRNDLFEINSLLDKLMFLSKLKPGMTPPSDKLSLNKLIKESTSVFDKELKEKGLSVLLDLDQDATILIPKEYAKVLLRNLLSNAVKYSKENSVIYLQTQKSDTKVTLFLNDQGFGINKFDLKRVEERFFRGEGAKKALGHGIGLSIVRRIADLYKIRLSIRSEDQKGTEVILEFPAY